MESQVSLRQLVLLEGLSVGWRGGEETETVTVRERWRGDRDRDGEREVEGRQSGDAIEPSEITYDKRRQEWDVISIR
jgi:hypothetical protein